MSEPEHEWEDAVNGRQYRVRRVGGRSLWEAKEWNRWVRVSGGDYELIREMLRMSERLKALEAVEPAAPKTKV